MIREPIPLFREGGFLEREKMFVLSYEGKVSEKKCFEDFRSSELFNESKLIEIISLKRPTNKGSDPISDSKNYIDTVLSEIQGRGYNKRPNPRIFLPSTRIAIKRAKELDDENQDYPKQLGSHIYKLIEKIIINE